MTSAITCDEPGKVERPDEAIQFCEASHIFFLLFFYSSCDGALNFLYYGTQLHEGTDATCDHQPYRDVTL